MTVPDFATTTELIDAYCEVWCAPNADGRRASLARVLGFFGPLAARQHGLLTAPMPP